MRIRNVSFDLVSFIGAVLMAACGVPTAHMRSDSDFAMTVCCGMMFWFLATILLLISLRLGNDRKSLSKAGARNEQLAQPPVSHVRSPKMQAIQWTVWLGVICLVLSVILGVLTRHEPYSNSILSALAAFADTKVAGFMSVAMWMSLLGILLLMLGSVSYVLCWVMQLLTRRRSGYP
ncbi:MAG: hypothetical protein NTW96_24780 [Planctomycetia bacterium]|nr:hypothetical protein [Planctomycetia bacterium]